MNAFSLPNSRTVLEELLWVSSIACETLRSGPDTWPGRPLRPTARQYVAVEGPKGAGKSTALLQLSQRLSASGMPVPMHRPFSAASAPLHVVPPPLESWALMACRDPLLARRLRYARSAWKTGRQVDWARPVLGDRSALTSLVTWLPPETIADHAIPDPVARLQASRILRLQPGAPLPATVLWLDAPLELLLQRCLARERAYGHMDETPERLLHAVRALQALREHPDRFGLPPITWIRIDATRPAEEVVEAMWSALREHAGWTASCWTGAGTA